MKEKMQNTKMFDEDMKKNITIAKKTTHETKRDNNLSFFSASTNCDKRKVNPNKNWKFDNYFYYTISYS